MAVDEAVEEMDEVVAVLVVVVVVEVVVVRLSQETRKWMMNSWSQSSSSSIQSTW